MSKTEKEITSLWKELGRDSGRLNLSGKPEKELLKILQKLKGIRIGFKLLFNPTGNHALALELLSNLFTKDEKERARGYQN